MKYMTKEMERELVEIRRYLHSHPELSAYEYKTTGFIEEKLKQWGIPFQRFEETGVIAWVNGSHSGQTVLLRADIDALPVKEKVEVSYRSLEEGVMHACGHDAHTAMLLEAAKVLDGKKEELKGRVIFVFQPAEETGSKTKKFVESELFSEVDEVFSMHVDPNILVGEISVAEGAQMAGVDDFLIEFIGEGGHGATPHLGTDAVLAGSSFIVTLQECVSREMNPFEAVVVTVGTFHAGTKTNILAEKAQIEGNIRFFNPKLREVFPEILKRLAKGTADIYRIKSNVVYKPSLFPLYNSKNSAKRAKKCVQRLYGENALADRLPSTTSEDFSRYLEKKEGVMVFLGTWNGKKETHYPLHHECFLIDENALKYGCELYVEYACEFLLEEK